MRIAKDELRRIYQRGYREGLSDFGMTYDNNPESERSRAYDKGRTARRVHEGLEDKDGNELPEKGEE
jgi:hypothetical protein